MGLGLGVLKRAARKARACRILIIYYEQIFIYSLMSTLLLFILLNVSLPWGSAPSNIIGTAKNGTYTRHSLRNPIQSRPGFGDELLSIHLLMLHNIHLHLLPYFVASRLR
jgi:hypothetical protein